ncbi:hypothetical protein BKE38_10620 [Pseudoroseomonas deserti]|uniref:HTH lysR-type domain-containing protein n=1 Tax=Teichococcus deserti TaxID=1817963 RepID=A0A1V2H354_9PROT|nr:LysR family transcriptional regulator [Pseudoroseomonas deserti]ONG54271.1 hypothetical protein BKE38_10620 [Pseudoroseomonas deserti]
MGATIAQMKAVEALSRTGRFSPAAGELGLSQPTVPAQLPALEQASRRRIFRRCARGSPRSWRKSGGWASI